MKCGGFACCSRLFRCFGSEENPAEVKGTFKHEDGVGADDYVKFGADGEALDSKAVSRSAKRWNGSAPAWTITNDGNPFEQLSDALVQRVFSYLGATESWERCRLWAVDRRFRRVLAGMVWNEIDLHNFSSEPAVIKRMTTRIQRGVVQVGAVTSVNVFVVADALDPTHEQTKSWAESPSAAAQIALLAALARPPSALQNVQIDIRSAAEDAALGPSPSQPAADTILMALLAALEPVMTQLASLDIVVSAPLRDPSSLLITLGRFSGLASLRIVGSCSFALSGAEAALLVTALPRLKTLVAPLADTASVSALAPLASLERCDLGAPSGLAWGLQAVAKGAAGSSLKRLGFRSQGSELAAELQALQAMPQLESLHVRVDATSYGHMKALGELKNLRHLKVSLWLSDMDPGVNNAALLALASAAATSEHLDTLDIRLYSFAISRSPQFDGSAAAALIRAGRRALRRWESFAGAPAMGGAPLTLEEARALALGGPQLRILRLKSSALTRAELDVYGELAPLRFCSPAARVSVSVRVPPSLRPEASATLRRWLPSASVSVATLRGVFGENGEDASSVFSGSGPVPRQTLEEVQAENEHVGVLLERLQSPAADARTKVRLLEILVEIHASSRDRRGFAERHGLLALARKLEEGPNEPHVRDLAERLRKQCQADLDKPRRPVSSRRLSLPGRRRACRRASRCPSGRRRRCWGPLAVGLEPQPRQQRRLAHRHQGLPHARRASLAGPPPGAPGSAGAGQSRRPGFDLLSATPARRVSLVEQTMFLTTSPATAKLSPLITPSQSSRNSFDTPRFDDDKDVYMI
eukprot:tig00021579_g22440.t1